MSPEIAFMEVLKILWRDKEIPLLGRFIISVFMIANFKQIKHQAMRSMMGAIK
jgi:hypothetical protein